MMLQHVKINLFEVFRRKTECPFYNESVRVEHDDRRYGFSLLAVGL